MEGIIIRCYEAWLIGALIQIGTRTLGHIQIFLVVSMALKQNPSIILAEDVSIVEYLQRTNALGKKCSG